MFALPALFQILKKLRVNLIYRQLKDYLPVSVMSFINSLIQTYAFTPLILESELKPQFRRALKFLIRYLGARPLGDYLEFGVCHGSSMICMHSVIKRFNPNRIRLFGFDSFEGLPPMPDLNSTGENWRPGDHSFSLQKATSLLTRNGVDWKRTFLIKGWYSETLNEELVMKHNITKASLIMIDCDIYSSAKESLDFCGPLIKDRSMIFFDDWSKTYQGEVRAFDEFLKENQHIKAEKFGSYKPYGEIFLVTNTLAY